MINFKKITCTRGLCKKFGACFRPSKLIRSHPIGEKRKMNTTGRKVEHTKMESKGRVFRPQGALIVFPCMGSVIQVTISPAWRTARIRWGNLTLMFSAPILVMMVILPGLFDGFKISISFTKSLGFILSLTWNPYFFSHLRTCIVYFHQFVKKKLVLTHLDAKRVGNTLEELNMRTVKLASALTNPEHVGRAIIEETRGGVLTG